GRLRRPKRPGARGAPSERSERTPPDKIKWRMPADPPSSPRRRLLAPEVVMTSPFDCGPAVLESLLEGFGVSVGYGRLREACQTSVDGSSIDTLESLAKLLGLEVEQVMQPVEHVFAPETRALPAIAVVWLPNGMPHFVVLWRRAG